MSVALNLNLTIFASVSFPKKHSACCGTFKRLNQQLNPNPKIEEDKSGDFRITFFSAWDFNWILTNLVHVDFRSFEKLRL